MDKYTIAANLANFLQDNNGSVFSVWSGKMPATQQRELFGEFLGKGRIEIDGVKERLTHVKKIAYGMDWEETFLKAWKDL